MNTSSRFVVAVHILVMLYIAPAVKNIMAIPSDLIARSVNTNPVVVRRILGLLRRAGLVDSHPGPAGGSVLARPASGISLLTIYRAVEEGELFPLHPSLPNQRCPIGKNIQHVLQDVLGGAEDAMEHALAEVTLETISRDIMAHAGMEAAPWPHRTETRRARGTGNALDDV